MSLHPKITSYPAPHAIRAQVTPDCRVPGCTDTAAHVKTGFCEAHHERYLDMVHDQTSNVGRGSR